MRIEPDGRGGWRIVYDDGRELTGFRNAGEASVTVDALVASSALAPAPGQTVPAPGTAAGELTDPAAIVAAITASTVEVTARPPDEWFANPGFTAATTLPAPGCSDIRAQPVTITDEGHVFGHLAPWGACHNGEPAGAGVCVQPPHSSPGYPEFRHGHVITASGARIATGPLTVGTGHATLEMSGPAAVAHYDHTGTAVADVVAGEDEYGIWVAGTVRPGATVAQVEALRRSPLSGDWRIKNGRYELVAALAVNSPGFSVPQYGLAASIQPRASEVTQPGQLPNALVAAGAQTMAEIQASPWAGDVEELRARLHDMEQQLTPLLASAAKARLDAALAPS